MNKESRVFVSYSHRDKENVWPIASYLGRLGLKVWMDINEMVAGQKIINEISEAVSKADLYFVFLSNNSIKSNWVMHELNTAITLETTTGRPIVIPIVLEQCEFPICLRDRIYIDSTGSFAQTKEKIKKAVITYSEPLGIDIIEQKSSDKKELILSSVKLELQAETEKYFGGMDCAFSQTDVDEEAKGLIKNLRRRANGVLLNFIDVGEMDFSSPYPKFPNGEYAERIKEVAGVFSGTIAKQAIVEVQILNPDMEKLINLISTKLEKLGVRKVSYSFVLSPSVDKLAEKVLQKIQKNYIILGWDYDQGAEVELPDDLILCVWCNDEQIKLSLETKYKFQLESRAKDFSINGFIDWLLLN